MPRAFRKLIDFQIPGMSATGTRGSLTIRWETARLVRTVAMAEGRAKDIDGVVGDMLACYVTTKHPDWKITIDDGQTPEKP